MASTFTSILLHVVFSTKDRKNLIAPAIESDLYGYMHGIIENRGSRMLCAGGTRNHVHLLVSLSKNSTIADLMEEVKKSSSKWIKTQGADFADFYWQEGYGAFSIGQSNVDAVREYIANQKAHHRQISFEDEFIALLKKYQVEYDERYIWR